MSSCLSSLNLTRHRPSRCQEGLIQIAYRAFDLPSELFVVVAGEVQGCAEGYVDSAGTRHAPGVVEDFIEPGNSHGHDRDLKPRRNQPDAGHEPLDLARIR